MKDRKHLMTWNGPLLASSVVDRFNETNKAMQNSEMNYCDVIGHLKHSLTQQVAEKRYPTQMRDMTQKRMNETHCWDRKVTVNHFATVSRALGKRARR